MGTAHGLSAPEQEHVIVHLGSAAVFPASLAMRVTEVSALKLSCGNWHCCVSGHTLTLPSLHSNMSPWML